MDAFVDWSALFSIPNAGSSVGNGDPASASGQVSSHLNLGNELHGQPSRASRPSTTSGFAPAPFQPADGCIPDTSLGADDDVYTSALRSASYLDSLRSQESSFAPVAYFSTGIPFSNLSPTVPNTTDNSPSIGLAPQAFQLQRHNTPTVASSNSEDNTSSADRSASEEPLEGSVASSSPSIVLPPANKENTSVPGTSKPRASISAKGKAKEPIARPSVQRKARKSALSQPPHKGKRIREENFNAPESVSRPSLVGGLAGAARTKRARVGRSVTITSATAGPVASSSSATLPVSLSSSNTPVPVAGPLEALSGCASNSKGIRRRVRRTKAELEQRAAPKVKRCGILNCSEDIGATPADANKHIKMHYGRAAALLFAGCTMAGVAEDVAKSNTSAVAQPGSDAEPEAAGSGPHEEADEPAATASVARWEGRYPCWYQETAASLMFYEITGKSYAGVYELQRHCKDEHHLWFFECQKCHRRFKRREEFRSHDLGCRYGG